MVGSVSRVKDDEARVVHSAVGIFETKSKLAGLERKTGGVGCEVEGAGAGEPFASADMVIEEKTEPQHPSGSQTLAVGKHETQWPDDVRGDRPQHLAFAKRLPHKAKFVILQIPQTTVDELRRPR